MDKKIKIAVIGVGNISNCHITAFKKNKNVEIVAFCDINEATLEEQGKRYGITQLFTSVDEMLAAVPELEAVSVCTWNSAHAECAIKSLNAGKHVLCEKPMAVNVADAIEMYDAAKRNNKILMIGFVRRFGNDCTILRDFIENDNLGEIYYAKAQYLRRNGNPGGWFGDMSRSGGGSLIDLGVHVIDLVRYLAGNPIPVAVYGATYHKLGNRSNIKGARGYVANSSDVTQDVCDVEDLAVAMIRFDNGMVLNVETSFSLNIKSDVGCIELFGSKGGAKLNPDLEMFTEMNGYLADVSLATQTSLSFDGLFENEINHFVEVISGKRELQAPAEDGIELMRILTAIYESARTKKEAAIIR